MILPKRLIEVDLPIKAISGHAQREKNVRQGHISNLHIWWARRPLAACRAIECAALWLDPVDDACPQSFRDATAVILCDFAEQVRNSPELAKLCISHWTRWVRTSPSTLRGSDPASWADIRYGLLDFIADFSNWDASVVPAFLETAGIITKISHLCISNPDWKLDILSDKSFTKSSKCSIKDLKRMTNGTQNPLIVDPFAGGGAIPLEALRIGADAFASDLNPIAVLLNKVILEYVPHFGHNLIDEIQNWGQWLKKQAEAEMSIYYPTSMDGYIPIAYLWARKIVCEGPGCGAEVPLLRTLWLANKGDGSVALQIVTDLKQKVINFEIIEKQKGKWIRNKDGFEVKDILFDGTVRRGSVTCPVCGYTTPVKRVREQLKDHNGGSANARLYIVVFRNTSNNKRSYRIPNDKDLAGIRSASQEYFEKSSKFPGLFPDEELPTTASGYFAPPTYGAKTFSDLFNHRQLLFARWLVDSFDTWFTTRSIVEELREPLRSFVGLIIDRVIDSNSSQCWWVTIHGETVMRTFGRQSYPMVWDFAEINPIADSSRGIDEAIESIISGIRLNIEWMKGKNAIVGQYDARFLPLPHDSCAAIISDPPYYNSIPYADLADFYYVWLSRLFKDSNNPLFLQSLSPKDEEVTEMAGWDSTRYPYKTKDWYELEMARALEQCRYILMPNGVMVLVFAHKETGAWEALISAVIKSGWIITGSWPISTENARRLRAQKSATLESSIHLVCRPRESIDGSFLTSFWCKTEP